MTTPNQHQKTLLLPSYRKIDNTFLIVTALTACDDSEIDVFFIFFFFQKRQLSAQSLAFNLKDKVFCELFPDVVDVRMGGILIYLFYFIFAVLKFPHLCRLPETGDEAEAEGSGGAQRPHSAPPLA